MNVKDKYTTYKLKLETMTPIFIGSGETLNKIMYYYNHINNTVKIVDEKKLIDFLAKNNLFDSFEEHIKTNGNKGNLFAWVKQENLNINNINIWKYELEAKNLKAKDVKRDNRIQLNEIQTFVKNANGPYIPGSSIKGVIKTAFLLYEIRHNKEKYSSYWDNNIKHIKTNDLEIKVFGEIKDDIFRALRISDSKPIDVKNLYIGQRADLPIHKKKITNMPMYMEFIKAETNIEFSLEIDETLNRNKYFTKEKIEKVLKEYIEFQLMLQEKFRKSLLDNAYLIDELDDYLPNIAIGGSVGYWSKTIAYALAPSFDVATRCIREIFKKDHKHLELDKNISPHTLKMIGEGDDYIPIGYGKLELLNK